MTYMRYALFGMTSAPTGGPGLSLRLWRIAGRMKQEEIASELGISQPKISKIEGGTVRPGLLLAVRIEALTGIPCRAWAPSCPSCGGGGATMKAGSWFCNHCGGSGPIDDKEDILCV